MICFARESKSDLGLCLLGLQTAGDDGSAMSVRWDELGAYLAKEHLEVLQFRRDAMNGREIQPGIMVSQDRRGRVQSNAPVPEEPIRSKLFLTTVGQLTQSTREDEDVVFETSPSTA